MTTIFCPHVLGYLTTYPISIYIYYLFLATLFRLESTNYRNKISCVNEIIDKIVIKCAQTNKQLSTSHYYYKNIHCYFRSHTTIPSHSMQFKPGTCTMAYQPHHECAPIMQRGKVVITYKRTQYNQVTYLLSFDRSAASLEVHS